MGTQHDNMTAEEIAANLDNLPKVAECQNCDWKGSNLQPIKDLEHRVGAGEPMPAGECPECGSLCHLTGRPEGFEFFSVQYAYKTMFHSDEYEILARNKAEALILAEWWIHKYSQGETEQPVPGVICWTHDLGDQLPTEDLDYGPDCPNGSDFAGETFLHAIDNEFFDEPGQDFGEQLAHWLNEHVSEREEGDVWADALVDKACSLMDQYRLWSDEAKERRAE